MTVNITPADLALYLSDTTINEDRAAMMIADAIALCQSVVNPLPDTAAPIVRRIAARGYVSTVTTRMAQAIAAGAEIGSHVGAGLTLTRADRNDLRRLNGGGGAFTINLLPSDYDLSGLPFWEYDESVDVATSLSGGTNTHAVVTAFTALSTNTFADVDIQVSDGSAYDPSTSFLCIAWDTDRSSGVTVQRAISDAGLSQDRERITVHCLLSVQDQDVPTARASALSAFNDIALALSSDRGLGGACTRANIGDYELLTTSGETGANAHLVFQLVAVAFI